MIDDDKAPLTQKQAIAKVSKSRGRSTSHSKMPSPPTIKSAISPANSKKF